MNNKHDNFADIFFGLILSITLFVFWVYGIALTADIPPSVSNSEAINQSIFAVLLTISYVYYAIKSHLNLANLIFLAIPAFFSILQIQGFMKFGTFDNSDIITLCIFIPSVLPCIIFAFKFLKTIFTKIKNSKFAS